MSGLTQNMPVYMLIPFVAWVLIIALGPLWAPEFWRNPRRQALLAGLFSAPVVWFLLAHGHSEALRESLGDYFSFMIMLTSLFMVAGGILISGKVAHTPMVNVVILLTGSVLANLIGTMGATMVLIRPYLRMNAHRPFKMHIPLFFLALVGNIGGCLSALGDPPLFLGYLLGVPFFWTFSLWPIWCFTVGSLLLLFAIIDEHAYRREPDVDENEDEMESLYTFETIRLEGRRNILFLTGIMWGVFLESPWREILMIAMTALSYLSTPETTRQQNGFSLAPIIDLAIVFIAIFITMVPAIALLKHYGASFGITRPWHFFWLAGSLSAFLDNAPTYLTFTAIAQGLTQQSADLVPEIIGIPANYLRAIATGTVFMGAMTYIGNGPNFMIKALAEEAGYPMPSFFGYLGYTLTILAPLFLVVTWLFFP